MRETKEMKETEENEEKKELGPEGMVRPTGRADHRGYSSGVPSSDTTQ